VCAAGLGPFAHAGLTGTAGLPLGDWRFWLFAGLVLVGELLPIDVPRRQGHDRVTTSTAFGFAILLLFGTFPSVCAYAAASVIADAAARLGVLKLLFNAAQYALAMAAAGLVMRLAGDPTPVVAVTTALPAMAAAGAVFFLLNHGLAGVAAALLERERPSRYLVADVGFQVLTAGFVLGLAPVVVAAAEASMALVPLCLLPVLAIYVGARQAARDAHRALHDELTDLPNRTRLHERTGHAIDHAHGGSVALLLVDLDDFKAVNDTMGHTFGDRLLSRVGARLRAAVAPEHLLARLGGDEFAVLLERGQGEAQARAVAAALIAALDEPFAVDGILLDVRASIGIACHPDHGATPDELQRGADVALYLAKGSPDHVAVYAPEQDHNTVDRLLLAGQLRRGIDAGEIVLEYQPKYPLRGGRPQGVEALARWEHPALGRVGPDGFIPLAEQTGLINPLTAAVLETAIAQCGAWLRDGLSLRVSVNVSPRSLVDRDLPRLIDTLLDDHGVPPELLQLEVTESRALPSGRTVLDELRTMGVSVAIDDFGTGFSSLVQLQRMPVDEIKIDRSFVGNMASSASDAAIVRSTIDLARNLGLQVTAEGVESEEAIRALARMGCELAQGYGLCRPVSADRCAAAVLACPELPEDTGPAAPTGPVRFAAAGAQR
jgi:diguanylate cyclase (GGDEF)-like protein